MDRNKQLQLRTEDRFGGLVAWVAIDNPTQLNALNSALIADLTTSFATLAANDGLRAVVLASAGDRAFIGGADITEMADLNGPVAARAFITRLHQCCDAIRSIPVPTIARIQGYCFGAGLELAASCDLRLASDNARFGMPEVKLGIPSVIEAALLPSLVGWGRTRQMLLLGEAFGAPEALATGLVERVVPAPTLDAALDEWLAELMTSAPRAVRLQKQLIRAWEDLPLRDAIQAGIDSFATAFETDEPKQAMAAFLAAQRARKQRR